MTIIARAYRGEADYQKVRELLIESYSINQRLHNWGLDRWDVFRYSGRFQEELSGNRHWEADVRLWEELDTGKLVAVANPEDNQQYMFLQIHPKFRQLEPEMLDWIEGHHRASRPTAAETWPLNFFVYEYDTERAKLLESRGYTNLGHSGYIRRCKLDQDISVPSFPAGYSIRNLEFRDPADRARLAPTCNAAFGHSRWTADTVRVLAQAPTYRKDLDLIVLAPDQSVAAFCILWLDEINRYAVFEPVGTHPDHRRRGLAKNMLFEGMHRLQTLGATAAYLGCGTDPVANRLYVSAGFTDADPEYHWRKEF